MFLISTSLTVRPSHFGLNISTPLQTLILSCVFNIILAYNAWCPDIFFLPMSFFNVSNAAEQHHWARLQLSAVKPVKLATFLIGLPVAVLHTPTEPADYCAIIHRHYSYLGYVFILNPAHSFKLSAMLSGRSSRIPRTTLRLQVKLERTHCQKKKTNRLKDKRDELGNKKKNPVYP